MFTTAKNKNAEVISSRVQVTRIHGFASRDHGEHIRQLCRKSMEIKPKTHTLCMYALYGNETLKIGKHSYAVCSPMWMENTRWAIHTHYTLATPNTVYNEFAHMFLYA